MSETTFDQAALVAIASQAAQAAVQAAMPAIMQAVMAALPPAGAPAAQAATLPTFSAAPAAPATPAAPAAPVRKARVHIACDALSSDATQGFRPCAGAAIHRIQDHNLCMAHSTRVRQGKAVRFAATQAEAQAEIARLAQVEAARVQAATPEAKAVRAAGKEARRAQNQALSRLLLAHGIDYRTPAQAAAWPAAQQAARQGLDAAQVIAAARSAIA